MKIMIASLGVGVFAVAMYLIVKLGLIKSWYILETLPGLLSARMIYAALPMGIGFLVLTIAPFYPSYHTEYINIWDITFYFCLILGFVFMIIPPIWIQPKWLRWLEREYGYCLDILIEEAQKMNRWEWEARVRTREGMQAWIDEVFARRRAEIEQRWIEEIKDYIPEHRRRKKSVPHAKKGHNRKRK